MKKATVTVTFDDEKLGALEFSLRKEHSSVQEHLEDALNALYEKNRTGAAAGVSGQQGRSRGGEAQASGQARRTQAAEQ